MVSRSDEVMILALSSQFKILNVKALSTRGEGPSSVGLLREIFANLRLKLLWAIQSPGQHPEVVRVEVDEEDPAGAGVESLWHQADGGVRGVDVVVVGGSPVSGHDEVVTNTVALEYQEPVILLWNSVDPKLTNMKSASIILFPHLPMNRMGWKIHFFEVFVYFYIRHLLTIKTKKGKT